MTDDDLAKARTALLTAYDQIHALSLSEPLYSTIDRGLNKLMGDIDLYTPASQPGDAPTGE